MKKIFFWIVAFFLLFALTIMPYIPFPIPFSEGLTNYFILIYKIGSIFIPILFLLGIVVSALIIIFNKKRKRLGLRILIILSFAIVLCLINNFFIAPKMQDYSKGHMIRRAEAIQSSLEKFKAAKGVYPDNIYWLVPNFIDFIPSNKVITIRKFTYQKGDNDDYFLFFTQQVNGWDYEVVIYNSKGNYDDFSDLRKYGEWRYYLHN